MSYRRSHWRVLAVLRETPSFTLFTREQLGVNDALAVSLGARRQGVKSALARAVEASATGKGAAVLELNVYQANPEAIPC